MPSLRLLRTALVLLLIALPLGGGARSQTASDAFTVRGIQVDVSAASIQAAKDQAIVEAQRQAFRQLLERLTVPADHARLPKADGVEYVRDFSVEQERAIPGRYMASLAVRFNSTAVKKLLQGANIPFAEPRPRALAVVPVFRSAAAKPVLWDDPNPWRAVWSGVAGGLVPLVVPAGDLTDSQTLSVEQALAGDMTALQTLAGRWRTSDVLVLTATLSATGKSLDVAALATPGAPKPFDSLSYQAAEGENADSMMLRAARDIARAVDTVYKQPNLLQFDRAASLSVLAHLEGLEDWLSVRERLGRVPMVRRWELVSLSKTEAALVVHFVGEQDQVRSALSTAGLPTEWNDGFWIMRLSGTRK